MNCKYCGNALPSSGGHCPNCGRIIPIDQMVRMQKLTDPRLNEYKNEKTAFYKQNQREEKPLNKFLIVIIIIILLIILIVLLKGLIG